MKGVKTGWVRQDVVTNSARMAGNPQDARGHDLLQKLIKSDNQLYQNLLVNAESITRLKARGIPVNTFEFRLNRIVRSYTGRQNKIKTSKLINFQTRLNRAFKWLADKFSGGVRGVGGIPLIPVAIGTAVGLGTGALTWITFRSDFSESTKDLKESRELQKLLDQADSQVASSIRADLEKQIDKAFAAGKTWGKLSFFGGSIKNLALFGLGALAIIKGPELLQSKTKRR